MARWRIHQVCCALILISRTTFLGVCAIALRAERAYRSVPTTVRIFIIIEMFLFFDLGYKLRGVSLCAKIFASRWLPFLQVVEYRVGVIAQRCVQIFSCLYSLRLGRFFSLATADVTRPCSNCSWFIEFGSTISTSVKPSSLYPTSDALFPTMVALSVISSEDRQSIRASSNDLPISWRNVTLRQGLGANDLDARYGVPTFQFHPRAFWFFYWSRTPSTLGVSAHSPMLSILSR